MRRAGTVTIVGLVLVIAGCSSTEPATTPPTPAATTVIEAENADACTQFGVLIDRIPGTLGTEGDVRPGWENLRAEFDTVALDADGETGERMAAFVDEWPKISDLMVYGDVDTINGNIGSVQRSCIADGNSVSFSTLTKG